MSQLAALYDERTANFSTSSATYVDAGSPTILNTDLTPGREYLIIARGECHRNIATTTSIGGVRMLHGSTPFDGSELLFGGSTLTTDLSNVLYYYMTVWAAVAGEDLKLQVKGDGTNTSGIRYCSLVAIPLGSDVGLTKNTDYFFNEDTADLTLTTTLTTGGTITWTPGTAGQKWLVLGHGAVEADVANADLFESRLDRIGEASAGWSVQMVGRAAGVCNLYPHMWIGTLGAVSQTWREMARRTASTGSTAVRRRSAVFALNLDKFDVRDSSFTDTKTDLSATAYGSALEAVNPTQLVAGGKVLLLASGVYEASGDTASRYIQARAQLDDADPWSGYTGQGYRFYYPGTGVAGQHQPYFFMALNSAMSAGAHGLDLDASVSAAASGRGMKFRRDLYLSLDVAPPAPPSGGPTTSSPRKNEQIMYQSDYSPNRRRVVIGPLVDATDGVTPEAGETGGIPQISKNGGAYASAPALSAIDASLGLYYTQLTQAQLDTLGSLAVTYKSAATARFGPIVLPVEECPWLWDGPLTGATTNTFTLGTGDVAPPTSIPAGSIIRVVGGTGVGQSAMVSSYTSPTGTLEPNVNWTTTPDATSKVVILPGLPPVTPDANVKSVDGSTAAATGLKEGAEAITTFLIVSGTNTTTVISTDLPTTVGGSPANVDQWKGRGIIGKSGRSLGDEAEILAAANVGGVIQLTVSTLAIAPAVGTKFVMT